MIIIFILFLFYKKLKYIRVIKPGWLFSKIKKHKGPKNPIYKSILRENCTYYQHLKPQDKQEFEYRVHTFILNNNFHPVNMEQVTDEMKVLISAAAVQITFGLKNLVFFHFKDIYVFPEPYFNKLTRHYHRGEVKPDFGSISLSWECFKTGNAYPWSGVNLGLHEMAHALMLENYTYNEEHDFISEHDFERFHAVARPVFYQMQNGGEHFFREYAATDSDEFFAVAVEYFFEKPFAFRETLPELYSALANVLKQDMAGYLEGNPNY